MAFNPEDAQARYFILFPRGNMVLSGPDASNAPGTPLVQLPLNRAAANQQWRVMERQDGIFTISSVSSGQVLTANPRGQEATVFLSQDTGASGQQWRIQALPDEQYTITSVLTSFNLLAAGTGDGGQIITAPEPLIFPPLSAVRIQPVV